MKTPGIVLVHGYSGRSAELLPLSRLLEIKHGQTAVHAIDLPGHTAERIPDFDARRLGRCVDNAVQALRNENRRIILLGHSTGGLLALDHIQRSRIAPALLILTGTPANIGSRDLERWERHRSSRSPISLLNVARMVSWANRVAATNIDMHFPVLVVHGASDLLVPPFQADHWRQGRFRGPVRSLIVPAAGHDLFSEPGIAPVLDYICRAIADAGAQPGDRERRAATALQDVDAAAAGHITAKPQSRRHLLNSPAVSRALKRKIHFGPVAETDPIQLNIEITSRCNLACSHCARSFRKGSGRDMELRAFEYMLDLLPNTYKVTLVGLGEPTLHPRLPDFVDRATQKGHLVSLVTNAMQLDKNLARKIVAAGIHSLTFSLDSVDPELAAKVRKGSDVSRILQNIQDFMAVAGGKVPTAVFTAVSRKTARHLPALAIAVAGLGVKAWMLSDLNFKWNLTHSLKRHWTGSFQQDLGRAIKEAFSRALPVLSVRGVEELGLNRRYADFLLASPACLTHRSRSHTWCLSPWQTLPVDVDGNALACDCRPGGVLGNVLAEPFSGIWNGAEMQSLRRQMRSARPPAECLVCPRF